MSNLFLQMRHEDNRAKAEYEVSRQINSKGIPEEKAKSAAKRCIKAMAKRGSVFASVGGLIGASTTGSLAPAAAFIGAVAGGVLGAGHTYFHTESCKDYREINNHEWSSFVDKASKWIND